MNTMVRAVFRPEAELTLFLLYIYKLKKRQILTLHWRRWRGKLRQPESSVVFAKSHQVINEI